MKRHLVMDLYYSNMTKEVGEWITFKDEIPPVLRGKFKVKLNNEDEVFAYFYIDKAKGMEAYGEEPCYFWNSITKKPLPNVVAWKELRKISI